MYTVKNKTNLSWAALPRAATVLNKHSLWQKNRTVTVLEPDSSIVFPLAELKTNSVRWSITLQKKTGYFQQPRFSCCFFHSSLAHPSLSLVHSRDSRTKQTHFQKNSAERKTSSTKNSPTSFQQKLATGLKSEIDGANIKYFLSSPPHFASVV